MTEIFYRDDFRVAVEFDRAIEAGVDFAGALYTEGTLATRRVRFGRRGGVASGCEVSADGRTVTVAADGHGLAPGVAVLQMVYLVPSAEMPDGSRRIERRYRLDVRLTAHEPAAGDCGCGCDGCAGSTPAAVVARVEIPWQYVHDTDVTNVVLEHVNDKFSTILGTEDVKPGVAPSVAKSASRPVLRRGLLNLRSARPDCVYKSSCDSTGIVETCVRLAAGEEVDLSQWIKSANYGAHICDSQEFRETHQVIKDGHKIKVEPADHSDHKVCVKLAHPGPLSHYIRKRKNGKLCAVSAGEFIDPDTLLPSVSMEEVAPWMKTQLSLAKNQICLSPINGMTIEIQRRRKKTTAPIVKKWRRWRPNKETRTILRYYNCALIRARYHTCKNVTGPWSYFFFTYQVHEEKLRGVCL